MCSILLIKTHTIVTFKLYAHLLCPIDDQGVTSKHFRAIWLLENIAESLAKMFNGITDCSSDGTIQYSDIIKFETINDDQVKFILSAHPYIKLKILN